MKFLICASLFFCVLVSSFLGKEASLLSEERSSVVVMGGGIGGLTSALYLARSGLTPLVIEGVDPGGLLKQSHLVQNWPGEMEIGGAVLIDKVRQQAEKSGAQFLSEEIVAVDFSKMPLVISTKSATGQLRQIQTNACIVAMGTEPNFLQIPGEVGSDGYWGNGVTNCAICDGPLYKDQIVGVVGGGDAAILEALYLSNIAKEVHVFVRKDKLKATEKKRVETLLARPNVKFVYNTEVASIQGDGEKVTGVTLKSKTRPSVSLPLDALFLAIGSKPNSSIFKNSLKLDKAGYILLEKDQQTSRKGVYAVGDIVDPTYKQAISAAGDGAKAALQAEQFLADQEGDVKKSSRGGQKTMVLAPPSTLIDIESIDQFEKELYQGDKVVIVDFYAPWCGPCKRISPLLDSLLEQFPSKLKILKVNIDHFPELSRSYNVRSIPTLFIFNTSAQIIDRKAGIVEITQVLKDLETDFDAVAARAL